MFESRDVEVIGRDDETVTVSVRRFDNRWADRDLSRSEVITLRDALTEWIGDQIRLPNVPKVGVAPPESLVGSPVPSPPVRGRVDELKHALAGDVAFFRERILDELGEAKPAAFFGPGGMAEPLTEEQAARYIQSIEDSTAAFVAAGKDALAKDILGADFYDRMAACQTAEELNALQDEANTKLNAHRAEVKEQLRHLRSADFSSFGPAPSDDAQSYLGRKK